MRKEYEEELAKLRKRMEDAEAFAKKLPEFEDVIIRNKYDGKEEWIHFGNSYKGMPFSWGITRGHYRNQGRRTVSNVSKNIEYDEYLFEIYINTLALYDSYDRHGLHDVSSEVELFFYDTVNTTFYATDEQIIPLLDALSKWYPKAKEAATNERVSKKKAKLLVEQERIASQLEQLNEELIL